MEINRRNLLRTAAAAAVTASGIAHAEEKSTERNMRRMDRALNKDEIDYLLKHTLHCVMSTTDKSGTPYGVAVSPVLVDGKFYFHCFNGKSRKMDNMRQNPKVSLFFIGSDQADQPVFALNYASVIVAGTAAEVTDRTKVGDIMTKLCEFQCPDGDMNWAGKHWMDDGKKVTMWEITPTKISGKARKKMRYFKDAPIGDNCATEKKA